jgi:hypothetical protein
VICNFTHLVNFLIVHSQSGASRTQAGYTGSLDSGQANFYTWSLGVDLSWFWTQAANNDLHLSIITKTNLDFWNWMVCNAQLIATKYVWKMKLECPKIMWNSMFLQGKVIFFSFFFFTWYWDLNSGPLSWATPLALFWNGCFQDRVSGTICLGWLWTRDPPYLCLLSS